MTQDVPLSAQRQGLQNTNGLSVYAPKPVRRARLVVGISLELSHLAR
jgi:hypothetical protein